MENVNTRKEELTIKILAISPEARELEHLLAYIPEIMSNNTQLQPLWERWENENDHSLPPQRFFTHTEIRILKAFFEYLSYASDRFISSLHGDLK